MEDNRHSTLLFNEIYLRRIRRQAADEQEENQRESHSDQEEDIEAIF